MISEKGGVRHGFSQIIYNSTEENVLDFITLQFSNLRAGDLFREVYTIRPHC